MQRLPPFSVAEKAGYSQVQLGWIKTILMKRRTSCVGIKLVWQPAKAREVLVSG